MPTYLSDEAETTTVRVEGVVVGFDGSPAAAVALDWGAEAAQAHGVPLTILTARPDAEADIIALPDGAGAEIVEPDIAEMLAEAADHVRTSHPDLPVATLVQPESPVDGLLQASATAQMIVIGSRGLGGFEGLLVGSTAMNITPYAQCPVVVQYVPDEATTAARSAARHPNEVVVGFDGSHFSEDALVFALRHAAAAGLGVAVVFVSKGSKEAEPVQIVTDDPDLSESLQEDLADAMHIAKAHPDVPVTYFHGVGRPAGVLIHEASGSPLAVIGARGRGGFTQLLLGSVGLQMLLHAECPVAIVRDLPMS